MTGLVTVPVDPRTDSRWERLARGAHGSLFTSPPWIDTVCGTYGFVPEARIAVDRHGVPLGGVAWVAVTDLRGHRAVSLPFSDRADPLVADPQTWQALAGDLPGPDVALRIGAMAGTPAAADPSFTVAGEAAWHGTPLEVSADELWRRLSGHARRNIRTARLRGVTVTHDESLEGVRRFHRMHVELRKTKYRLLAQPVEFFERLWHTFRPSGEIRTLFAWADDTPVAGALLLEWEDVLYYKFGASHAAWLHLRPNDAVFWAALEHGLAREKRRVDWGRSDLDQPGLISYKRKWATDERRILTLSSRGSAPDDTAAPGVDALLGELTRLLTGETVPTELTTRAGALLYRYFC